MRHSMFMTLALLSACSFGPSLDDVNARIAAGVDVEVRREEGEPVFGELVGWVERGPVILISGGASGSTLVLVPAEEVRQVRTHGFGRFSGSAAQRGQGSVRFVARYPYPITDELLARLLQAYGQTALERAGQ